MALLALALLAVGLNLAATRHGPGMTSDSITYLAAADTWLRGMGLGRLSGPSGFKPMTHFPPLFPLLLAAGEVLGATGIQAGRWMNALFQGGTILVVGLFLGQITRNVAVSLLGTGLLVLSPTFLDVESQVMSEAPFLFLGFFGLWLLATANGKGARWRFVLGGCSIGLAYLARYVGISLVVTGALYLILHPREDWRSKARKLTVFLCCSVLPIVAWMVRNLAWTGVATNRRWVWHPPPLSYFESAFRLLWHWASPLDLARGRTEALAGLLGALVILTAVLWGFRQIVRQRNKSVLEALSEPMGMLLLFCGIYLGIVLISRTFLDATTPFDDRIAAPIYLALSTALPAIGWRAWDAGRGSRFLRLTIAFILALAMSSFALRTVVEVGESAARHRGALASAWRAGPLQEVWNLPAGTVIYTDNLERLYYYYGRGGYQIMHSVDVVTGLPRPNVEQEHAKVREQLIRGQAVVFLLASSSAAVPEFPDVTGGLAPVVLSEHGALYVGPL